MATVESSAYAHHPHPDDPDGPDDDPGERRREARLDRAERALALFQERGHLIRADAMTNAATLLIDAKEAGRPAKPYPGYWADIERYVIPLLEAEAGVERR